MNRFYEYFFKRNEDLIDEIMKILFRFLLIR